MKPEELQAQEAEWREKYPTSFVHAELREGEMFLGDVLVDVVYLEVRRLQSKGVVSTRMGEKVMRPVQVGVGSSAGGFKNEEWMLDHYPLFVNIREFIEYKARNPAKA
jgi:hypothetical protein